ncbi:MAG: glycosyl hydrolase [Anaerolineales bacterium]|jgi:hypothetical protein
MKHHILLVNINNTINVAHKLIKTLLVLVLLAGLLPPVAARADTDTPDIEPQVYMPLGFNHYPPKEPIMLGIYPDQGYWYPSLDDVLTNQFGGLGRWGGKRLTLAGIFHNLLGANEGVIGFMFSHIRDHGLIPFANLYINASASSVANGSYDAQIATWARLYKSYADAGGKAFLAPMQEMNIDTSAYFSTNTSYYKTAYRRIRNIFDQQGVPADSVYWVFAPNGWSRSYHPPFEDYYPGDDVVDVVAFSAYNFGGHPNNPYPSWKTPEQVFGAYIERMRALAPDKPIIVAQTGTTAWYWDGDSRTYSTSMKNAWLEDCYTYLAAQQGVIGIIYYNTTGTDDNRDWLYYENGKVEYFTGYQEGVASPVYEYIPPADVGKTYFP